MTLESHVKELLEELLNDKIKKLLVKYDHNDSEVTKDLNRNKGKYIREISDKIIKSAEAVYPNIISKDKDEFESYIRDELVKDKFEKRMKDHEMMLSFENSIIGIRGDVDRDYAHMAKEQRNKIKNDRIGKLKYELIRKGELTDELYKKVMEKDKLKKAEKEAKKAWRREEVRLEKERELGKYYIGHGEDYFKPGLGGKVRFSKEFEGLTRPEKGDMLMRWYEQEMQNLRAAYNNNDITMEEFKNNAKELKDFLDEKLGDYGPKIGKIPWKIGRASRHAYGDYLKNIVYVLGAIIIGVVVSATTGSWLFFFGFLSVGLHLLFPDPRNVEPRKEQKIGSGEFFRSFLPPSDEFSAHNGLAFIKSLTKVSAIVLFALAFKGLGDVFNIFYIGIAIFGYFLLSVDYDPEIPAEFIESVLRFFIGIIFIPQIFVGIFDSWVLGAIALAFFAVPPLPKADIKNLGGVLARGLSGVTAYYEMGDKIVFGGLMIVALLGSGAVPGVDWGWQLEGTLAYTFIYFWVVCGVAGFFSPARERPVTGAIMLGAATIIYGIGPGSQQVGSGLLGQWWPTVHNAFTSFTTPMADIAASLSNTFGQGFMLIMNPVGYATQLMNGTYAENPVGKTGSYGVDITEFTITDILPEQPFVVTAILENNGAFEAKNVEMGLEVASTDKYATTNRQGLSIVASRFDIKDFGFTDKGDWACDRIDETDSGGKKCVQCYNGCGGEVGLDRLMVWQAAFQSTEGIKCEVISKNALRKKYLPFRATVTYDYQSDSRVEVEFISKAEWERLAQAGQLDTRFRLVQSQYSSAPVIFPIGTAGLKNPILEDQQFHISMRIDSAFQSNSYIVNVGKVSMTYPKDWKIKGKCTPEGTVDSANGVVTWEFNTPGAKNIVCYFEPLGNEKLAGAPSKSYVVTSHAEYRFSRWKYVDTEIKFGGFCCPDSTGCSDEEYCPSQDCLKGQYCMNNACVYKPGEQGTVTQVPADFCSKRPDNAKCVIGMGGCTSNGHCCQDSSECPSGYAREHALLGKLECRTGIGNGVCCYEHAADSLCREAYEGFEAQVEKNSMLIRMLDTGSYTNAYPDVGEIYESLGAALTEACPDSVTAEDKIACLKEKGLYK